MKKIISIIRGSRFVVLTAVFLLVLFSGTLSAEDKILPGNNDFDSYIPLIESKRVALFTNQSGTLEAFTIGYTDEALPEVPRGKHILDELIERGIDVACVFSPEHGFRGNHEAGAKVSDYTDESTGTRIISLYGVNVHDAVSKIANKFDVVLVDIQDVGLRYYTYYITMMRIMNVCAELGKPVIILDRPNPNGFFVDGPILNDRFKSGVGALNIPVVHGLTLGELAMMINGEGWLTGGRKCELKVIPCKNYSHSMKFMLNCRPSPNIKSMRAVYLYASTCYFENTLVSVGRGTDYPFEVYGSPAMKNIAGYEFTFTPRSMSGAIEPLYMNTKCYGKDLRNAAMSDGINLSYLINAYNSLGRKDFFGKPDKNKRYWIDKLFGTDEVKKMIQSGKSESEIKDSWQKGIREFMNLRSKYIIYPD